MSRAFVFCIGGTGLRVMKSILMLCASGMKTNGFDVIPIILDPHVGLQENGDLKKMIEDYEGVYDRVTSGGTLTAPEGFFGTRLCGLGALYGNKNNVATGMNFQGSLGDYLDVGNLGVDDINTCLVNALFSSKDLNNSLSVGFKGNPNVGTVVLNEMFGGANWYDALSTVFQQNDRIFMIASIFGGTGAAGYPLLEKLLREHSNDNLKNALMGAVTVLPYFSLTDPKLTDSDIDSANFYTKSKAALGYYEGRVRSDYMYYAGEQSLAAAYDNNEAEQKDKAHFIELVAATAFFDFLRRGRPTNPPQFMTRGVKNDRRPLKLSDLGAGYNEVVKVVADMAMLKFLCDLLKEERQFPLKKTKGLNEKFFNDESFGKLKTFLDYFHQWYEELSKNDRGFAPLNVPEKGKNLEHFIDGLSLEAKNESYYLLEMVKAGNKLRYLLDYAYRGISRYTNIISEDK